MALKDGDDFVAQFFGNHFVRVNRQQPRLRGIGGGEIAVRRVAAPRLAENFRAVALRDFVRAIRHLVVNRNNDFARPACTLSSARRMRCASLPATMQTEMGSLVMQCYAGF